MSIVIAAWLVWPLILVAAGFVLLVIGFVIDANSGGGYYGMNFAGCLPILGTLACWFIAGGMIVGHYL